MRDFNKLKLEEYEFIPARFKSYRSTVMTVEVQTQGGIMGEKLVNLHLIEPGTNGRESLFEVSLLLDGTHRDALRDGDRDAWRRALGRARHLIDSHVAEKRAASGF